MKVWLNGKIVDERRAVLSVFDHGFLYGDGLYETVRVANNHVALWTAHYRRLKKSARLLHFSFPWSAAALEKAVRALASANHQTEATARLTLSRGMGALGLDPALCSTPTLVIQMHPPRDLDRSRREGVSVGIVSTQRTSTKSLDPALKSTSAQNLVSARMQAKRLGVFEGVLLNARGEITEGTVSNLFFVRRGVLHTPALSCGLLPGVTRAHILRLARRLGIAVREGHYKPRVLEQAEEIFLTNASFEIMPVRALRTGSRLQRLVSAEGLLTQRLQKAYRQSML